MAKQLEETMESSMSKLEEMMKDELNDLLFKYQEGLPEKIGEEDIKGINEGLAYYHLFKEMIMEWAAVEDARYAELSKKLDRIQSKLANIEDMERCSLPRKKCC